MKAEEINRELRQADPASARRMAWLQLGPAEAALAAVIVAEPAGETVPEGAPPAWPRAGRRRLGGLLGLAAAAATAAVVALVLLAGGGSQSPSRAYGADLVRFAESSPLLLLEAPGWRVQNANETRGREGIEGSMEFVTGKPIPYETITVHADGSKTGMFPASVRQRRVQLYWRQGGLAQWLEFAKGFAHPHGQHWITLPVLDTSAQVNTRAEGFANHGGPDDREMLALWSEGGYVLELRAAVPDRAGFEERLAWLTKVDLGSWLEAMPPQVVKAGDHDAAVREMLTGIPLPATFAPSRVPDEGLNTDRYQVGAKVTGTVACLWLRQWGEARRSGDEAAAREAERAMATSRRWPILREMNADGDYPEVVWEIAAAMPQGYWEWAGHRRRLLPHAEGLGCARIGLPLLPRKMKLQRERGLPPPP